MYCHILYQALQQKLHVPNNSLICFNDLDEGRQTLKRTPRDQRHATFRGNVSYLFPTACLHIYHYT